MPSTTRKTRPRPTATMSSMRSCRTDRRSSGGSGSITVNHASGITATLTDKKAIFDGNVEITGNLSVDGQTTLKDTTINGIRQVGS